MPSQMLVTVDKEDFVVGITREESDLAEVHRSEQIQPTTRLCKGPWHYKAGRGTMVDIREFHTNFRTGDLNKTCDACLKGKTDRMETRALEVAKVEQPVLVAPIINGEVQKLELSSAYGKDVSLPQWRVTIIKRTEEIVYAKDFLDAAAQAGDGEVLKVERLD